MRAAVLGGVDALLAHEAVPLGTRAEAGSDVLKGVFAVLECNQWADWPVTPQVTWESRAPAWSDARFAATTTVAVATASAA